MEHVSSFSEIGSANFEAGLRARRLSSQQHIGERADLRGTIRLLPLHRIDCYSVFHLRYALPRCPPVFPFF